MLSPSVRHPHIIGSYMRRSRECVSVTLSCPLVWGDLQQNVSNALCNAVIGALCGVQNGRQVDIFSSFDIVATLDASGTLTVDHDFFAKKAEQCLSSSLDMGCVLYVFIIV